ncbi:hypothetical protein CAL7716_066420 [Calothrix sp. PCC 7716]|nr:hypothetical protein CAL7716_066420 [Calothrix sp. PCC 7716]
MALKFIQKLFQKLKRIWSKFVFRAPFKTDKEHLDDGDEIMGTSKKVWLTEKEYKDLLNKFPAASPSVVKEVVHDINHYSITIKELYTLQKRDGEDVITDDCIEYVKSKKNNPSPHASKTSSKNSSKSTQTSSSSSQKKILPTDDVNASNNTCNKKVGEALSIAAITSSNEISSLANEKQTELKKSSEPSITNLPVSENNEQKEATTEVCVNFEQEALAPTAPEKYVDAQEKLTTWKWRRVFGAVVGSSHLRVEPPVPCQDAALAVLVPRPAIFVADGAGSARLSHFGSSAVVRYLNRFIASIEDINQEFLDQDRQPEVEAEKRYAYRFVKYTLEILQELSQEKREPVDLFKCTLLITIIGKSKLFWLKVGDGSIVIEKDQALELIGPLGKGDFANQTTFVTENITDKDIHYGFLDARNVTAVAAFTDGAAEKLVSTNGLQISRSLGKIFHGIRTREYNQDDLHEFLSNKDVWLRTTGDDKGIAILSSLL